MAGYGWLSMMTFCDIRIHSGNIWQASCGSMSSSMSSSSSAFCMVDCLKLHEASGNGSVAVQHNRIINYQLRPQMYKKIFNDSIWNQYDSMITQTKKRQRCCSSKQSQAWVDRIITSPSNTSNWRGFHRVHAECWTLGSGHSKPMKWCNPT